MLIDTNGDGIPDRRQFAGTHRYNTAVALAERFAADEGSISTVIIASGESQVDAVTAAGLAGNLNAPVLLTRSNQLPHNVARFIDEQNVSAVIIVGGTAAVPDAIQTAIEALGSRPKVERVSGTDRYGTAAAIGGRLGGPTPTWCNSKQPAAILVNGGDAGRADAIVAGPLAFSLGLPILLTMDDEVPDSTAAFLTDNRVERVVVIGGTKAVSAGVANTLVEDIGVVNVHRISGGSAAGTSVDVANEMLGNCAGALQTDRDRVALINRDATADGIAAAPVLGRGLGNGPVPILLVGNELPAVVSDYLAGTLESRPGHGKTHMSIVAIGGTAVVSDAVMADAVAAAKTSKALTAEITPVKYKVGDTIPAGKAVGDYATSFTVTFSDNVREPVDVAPLGILNDAERHGTALDPTMYRVNGRRIEAAGTTSAADEPATLADLVFTANRTVTVKLSHHLNVGDTITVDNKLNEDAGLKLGAAGDLRNLEPASLELGAVTVPSDTAAPVVEIVAVPGQGYFDVIVTEPNLRVNELGNGPDGDLTSGTMTGHGSNLDEFVEINGRRALIPAGEDIAPTPAGTTGNSPGAANTPRSITVGGFNTHVATTWPPGANGVYYQPPDVGASGGTIRMRFPVNVTNPNAPTGVLPDTGATRDQIADPDDVLRAGDVITIKGNAFIDKGGRRNRLVQYTVPRVKTNTTANGGTGNLRVDSVSIGDYVHTNQASAIFGGAGSTLTVTATATGVAAGAAGNSWVIFGYDDRRDRELSSYAFDIDVDVDVSNQRIAYTISDVLPRRPLVGTVNSDGATLHDLAVALVSDSDFSANFRVDYGDRATQTKATLLGATGPAGVSFGDDAEGEEVGRTSVGVRVKFNADLFGLWSRTGSCECGVDLAYDIAPDFPLDLVEGHTATNAVPDAYDVTFRPPDDVVHITYTADRMAKLPKRVGFRVIEAVVAAGYPDYTLRRHYGYNGAGAARTGYEMGDLGLSTDDNAIDPVLANDGSDRTWGVPNVREILNTLRADTTVGLLYTPRPVDGILDIEVEAATTPSSTAVTLSAAPDATIDEGGTYTYSLKLDGEPDDTVVVTFAVYALDANGDPDINTSSSLVTVNPARLVFTPSNWDIGQEVTLTAIEDDNTDEDKVAVVHTATSTDSAFNGTLGNPGTVTIVDNDAPSVIISTAHQTVDETSTLGTNAASYTVRLGAAPSAGETVTIAVSSADTTVATVTAGTSLTFDASNWDTPQTVTVTAANDDVDSGDRDVDINHAVTTSDTAEGAYADVTADDVTITVIDDDDAGVTVTTDATTTPPGTAPSTPLEITETDTGATGTFSVVLTSEPTANVTFVVRRSSGSADVTVAGASSSLTFTDSSGASSWSTAQDVTVNVADDSDAVDETAWVTLTSSSADSAYNGLTITVRVNVDDND